MNYLRLGNEKTHSPFLEESVGCPIGAGGSADEKGKGENEKRAVARNKAIEDEAVASIEYGGGGVVAERLRRVLSFLLSAGKLRLGFPPPLLCDFEASSITVDVDAVAVRRGDGLVLCEHLLVGHTLITTKI